MYAALDAVEKGMSYRRASQEFSVPKSTLHSISKGKSPVMSERHMGPRPTLTEAEETSIVEWLLDLAKTGFPRKKVI